MKKKQKKTAFSPVSFRTPPEHKQAIKELALQEGIKPSDALRKIVSDWFEGVCDVKR